METVVNSVKIALAEKFKKKILKFILIGSRMSNQEKDNSDFDIIVVTDDSTDSYELIKEMTHFISIIAFQYKSVIGIYPVKKVNLEKGKSQFINNIITKGSEF